MNTLNMAVTAEMTRDDVANEIRSKVKEIKDNEMKLLDGYYRAHDCWFSYFDVSDDGDTVNLHFNCLKPSGEEDSEPVPIDATETNLDNTSKKFETDFNKYFKNATPEEAGSKMAQTLLNLLKGKSTAKDEP